MAYEALHPLQLTIHRLKASSRLSIESPSQELLKIAYSAVKSALQLVGFLEDFIDDRTIKALVPEIREAAFELEDALDSRVSEQFDSQFQTQDLRYPLRVSLDLQGVTQDVDGFTQKMKKLHKVFNPWFEDTFENRVTRSVFISWYATKAASIFSGMKEEYIEDLKTLLPEDDDDYDYDYGVVVRSGFSIFELERRYRKIRYAFTKWWIHKAVSFFLTDCICIHNPLPREDDDSVSVSVSSNMVGLSALFCKIRDDIIDDKSRVYPIVGMAGIGKTALAMKILEDPLISSKFEFRIFVRIGQEYRLEEIMQTILAQLDLDEMPKEGNEDLQEYLGRTFKVKKALIVLDDVWNEDIWMDMGRMLPYGDTISKALVTSRRASVAGYFRLPIYNVPFLNAEESWDLLRGKIFGEKRCPHELVKAGKKIAENCEGLPLLILTVADLLSEAERTPESWSRVAANKTNSIFVDAYEQVSEVMYPSYDYLPQDEKTCFLYMAAIPQNCDVRLSKLINLWSAEGFYGFVSFQELQSYVEGYFEEIVSSNLALGNQQSSIYTKPKACSLHSVFWYLCKREARNDKFFYVLNSYKDASADDIESHRRLSVYKNVVFSIRDVRDSIASIPAVRSLLCTGPYHQYQVPICLDLRLLKILDALTIRFYEFPLDVVKLLHLKYLSITCNGNLPPSISKLWNLQCLILGRHMRIKSCVSQSYLPVEIWELQELEYLQIMGRNLPDPPPRAVLRNLATLLDVGAHTCNKRVFKRLPNLRKLRVQIESDFDAALPWSFYDDISLIRHLTSLQYLVVHPNLISVAAAPAPSVSASRLKKLTLSGCGYHWKDMNKIAELPNLLELKLKCYAFQGEKWQVKETDFSVLIYLLIEDTDLVQWTGSLGARRQLRKLTIKNCYKLKELPKISSVTEVRLVDCNPSAVTCAKKMAPSDCSFYVESSW